MESTFSRWLSNIVAILILVVVGDYQADALRAMRQSDRRLVLVLVSRRHVARNARITEQDVALRLRRVSSSARALRDAEAAVNRYAVRDLQENEVVSPEDVGERPTPAVATGTPSPVVATISVENEMLGGLDLSPGDRIDVWTAPEKSDEKPAAGKPPASAVLVAGDLEVLATAPADGEKKATRVYVLLPREPAPAIVSALARTNALTITRGYGVPPKPEPKRLVPRSRPTKSKK